GGRQVVDRPHDLTIPRLISEATSPGCRHDVFHRGSQLGCVVSPIAAITGSIGLPQTVHMAGSLSTSVPSVPASHLPGTWWSGTGRLAESVSVPYPSPA